MLRGFQWVDLFIKSWDTHHCNFSSCQGKQECCFFFWQCKNPLTLLSFAPYFRYEVRNFQITVVVHKIQFHQKGTLLLGMSKSFKAFVTWKALNNKCCQRTYVALICCGHTKLAWTDFGNERRFVLLPRGHGILPISVGQTALRIFTFDP